MVDFTAMVQTVNFTATIVVHANNLRMEKYGDREIPPSHCFCPSHFYSVTRSMCEHTQTHILGCFIPDDLFGYKKDYKIGFLSLVAKFSTVLKVHVVD